MVKLLAISACILSFLVNSGFTVAQLVVNVKDSGGDVFKEAIHANTTQDTVILKFEKWDGTQLTQFIDFKNEVQIFRSLILGEMERGQHGYQVMCFVTRLMKSDFISSDAMSKLRQKNPGAIRTPEEDKGQEEHSKDLLVDLSRSHVISPHILDLCHQARHTTYMKQADLDYLSKSLGRDLHMLSSATSQLPAVTGLAACGDSTTLQTPCVCRYDVCVLWYPCGLKYCKGKDTTGKTVNYRCGIKTCSKCRRFQYYVKHKLLCLWEDH